MKLSLLPRFRHSVTITAILAGNLIQIVIFDNNFVYLVQTVPNYLDEVYFTAHVTDDGIYFKVRKERTTRQ